MGMDVGSKKKVSKRGSEVIEKGKRTSPVTGDRRAREVAYDTDWGISMHATVIPARKSPPNLDTNAR